MKKMHLLAIVLWACLSCRQKETLTREEIVAVVEKFDTAWKNKNLGTVDSVLTPSYVYFTQSSGTFDRKNVVQTAGSADYKLDTVTRKLLDIKIEGNTAIVNTIWTGKGSYFGNSFNDTQRCSITIIKNNREVKLLSEHCTLVK